MKQFYAFLAAIFISAASYAQCNYQLILQDNFGQGWTSTPGAGVSVTINGGTPTLYTVQNAGTAPNIETYTIAVTAGDALVFDYTPPAFSGDGQWSLQNSEGIVLFNSGFNPDATADYSGAAACPTCPAVTMLTISNVDSNSAVIGWTVGGSETEWEIEYGVSPYTVGSGGPIIPATSNPAPISGLSSVTTYDVYVRAKCGPGDVSSSRGPLTFTTTESCPAPSNFLPITNTPSSISFVWDSNGNSAIDFVVEYGPAPYTQGSGGQTQMLSPAPFADVTGLTSATTYNFFIQIDCGNGDFSTWAGPYTATTLISCPAVTNIVSSNITANEATVAWTAGGSETAWEVEYAPFGTITTPGTGQGITVSPNPTSTSVPLTGLNDSTRYQIFVRAICDPALPDYSTWVSADFTTLCLIFAPTSAAPYAEDFESFTPTTTFVEELCYSATSTDAYDWNIDGAASTPSAGTGPTGANSGTNYFYVEASSGTTGVSNAILNLPEFDLSGLATPSLQFYYHMFGNQIGTLNVEVDDLTGSGWTVVKSISGRQQNAQADPWLLQIVNLGAYSGQTIGIRFRAVSAGTFEGDISLDDMYVGDLPPCADPNFLTTTAILDTQATLSWSENGTATMYQVEVGAPGFAVGTGAQIQLLDPATNPVTVSGLTPVTTYSYYVRANCGTDGFSAWVGPFNFTTKCAPIAAPYIVDVEAFTAGVDFVSSMCWEGSWNSTTTTEWNWNIDGAASTPTANTGPSGANSGVKYFYVEGNGGVAGNEAILLAPIVDLTGLTAPSLQFATHMFGASTGILHVDINDGTGFTNDVLTLTGQQQISLTAPWDIQVIDLAAYAGGNVQVRFRAERTDTSTAGTSDISLDDINFGELPACPQPSAFQVGTLTDTTAALSWNENGSATSWNIEYGPCGFTPGDGTSTTVVAGTNPFTLIGLSAFTCYDYYIVADCGTGTLSAATGPGTFTTECSAFAAPFLDTFEAFTANVNFVEQNCWEANSDTTFDWNVDNNGSTPSTGTGPLAAFSGTTYFYVEASNGAAGNEARLLSPLIDITALTTPSIQFKYHMFGAQIGVLHVDVNDGTGWINDVGVITGQQQTAQSDDWLDGIFDLAGTTLASNVIQVRLRATSAGTFAGDISIDDFRVDDIPTCPVVTALTTGAINSSSAALSWTAGGTEVEWIVEYRVVGTTAYTVISPNTTAPTISLTGLMSNTQYEVCVSAVCGPGDISQRICSTIQTTPDYCAGDLFTDTGGVNGNYQNSENITYNICPENAGDVVYVNFTFNDLEDSTSGCFDGLTIYDGPDTTFPTINTPAGGTEWCWDPVNNSGTGNLVGQLLIGTSTTGCITFVWSSDGSVQRPGWSANVTCAPPPTCDSPTALTTGTLTDTTAELAWTLGGTETEWNVEVGLPGFMPDTMASVIPVINTTTNPVTATGLTAETDYEYYVQAVCAPGDESIFIGPFAFTTQCSPFTSPYFQNFEAFAATTTFVDESCWSASSIDAYNWNVDNNGSTPTAGTGPLTGNSGSTYLYVEASSGTAGVSKATLLSPMINLSGLTTPSVEFFYHMFGAQIGTLELEINDGTGWANVVTLGPGQIQTTQADAWNAQISDLSAYVNATVQFRFIATSNGTVAGDISIDDFKVDELPACPNPSILNITNVTTTTAVFGWTENGSAAAWEVEVQPFGVAQGTAGAIYTNMAATNPQTISGLNATTRYSVYVRAICNATDFSNWVGPLDFITSLQGPLGVSCTTGAPGYIWEEGFNTIATNWTGDVGTGTTNGDWNFGRATAPGSIGTGPNGPFEGGGYLYFETSGTNVGPARIVSPPIDLTTNANDALELSFYYHAFGGDDTQVEISYGLSATGPWTPVFSYVGQVQTGRTVPYQAVGAMLPSSLIGQTIYIQISGTEEPGNEAGFVGDVAIDLMRIQTCGSFCSTPSVVTLSGISSNSVTVDWTENGTATEWEVVVVPAGSGVPTGNGTSTMVRPYVASNLNSSSNYEVYVRAVCGPNFYSDWTSVVTFATSCAPFAAPYGSATGTPGNNFTTFPGVCWTEGNNTAIAAGPNGLDSAWSAVNFGNAAGANGLAARINIYDDPSVTNDWLVTPEFNLGATGHSYAAIFDVALTDFAGQTATTLGSDDSVQLLITTDGVTWSNLFTWNAASTVSPTGQNESVSLAAYSGVVRLAFWATNGTVADAADVDFFIDNFTIDGAAGISSQETLGFTFYPNPTKDILNVVGVETIESLTLRNLMGQTMVTIPVNTTNAQIDLSDYATGVYLLEVSTAGTSNVIRVIKE